MKRWNLLILICVILCTGSSCGKIAQNKASDESVSSTESPLVITEGFVRKDIDKGDGLTLLAVLGDEVRTKEKEQFVFNNIFLFPEQKALVSYSLFDEEGISKQDYLASYDYMTDMLGEPIDISDDEDSYSYLDQNTLLWCWNVGDKGAVVTGYDGDLHPVREFVVPADIWGEITVDGKYFYYISNGKLYRNDTSQEIGEAEEVVFDTAFSPQMIGDIFRNEKKENCGLFTGIAGDLKIYSAIANLDTGEILYMNTEQDITYIENGVFAVNKNQTEEEISDNSSVGYSDGCYEYDFREENSPYMKFLDDNLLLFVSVDYESMEDGCTAFDMWLYDRAKGTKLGSARLTSDLGYAYIMQAVSYPGEDMILLCLTEEIGDGESLNAGTEFYRWKFSEGQHSLNDPIVTEQEPSDGLLGDIIEEWDPAYFTPEECPQEFADLREKADQLESKFGIELKISEECKGMFNSEYAVTPVSDREKIDGALSALEYELSKYPEDFFRQFMWEEVQGIDIYLSGPLIGMDESVLDIGGGMTTIESDRLVLIIDCTEEEPMRNTIHHEIAHAIDRKLQQSENNFLDESKWDDLNPFPDMYSYSYEDYMNRDYEGEGLFDYIYVTGKAEETYFTDIYGLTYPSEDRAQIFALSMMDDNEDIWQKYPCLKAKLDYYAQCIREGFDTKKWDKIWWEKV